MNTGPLDEQTARLNKLSECLFGDAAEVDTAEAEELMRTAGIDPDKFKDSLYHKMLEQSQKYSDAGRPLPPLLKQALEDLRPSLAPSQEGSTPAQTEKNQGSAADAGNQGLGLPKTPSS